MTRALVRGGCVAVAVTLASLPAAVGVAAQDQIMEQGGVRYVCTGIGESKEDPRWRAFALKLVFATEPRGALLSNVRSRISDRAGRVVLDVHCPDEPWLIAGLAPGRYRISATANGGFNRTVNIVVRPGRQTYTVIRFPSAAGK